MRTTPLLIFLFGTAAFAQAPVPADPVQALLAEVHQLRLELQATTITAQRVQILLSRLQLQQNAVARALTRSDEAHTRLLTAQQMQTRAAQELEQLQDAVDHPSSTDAALARDLQSRSKECKQNLERWQAEEEQWQAKDTEAQSQLRTEQGKLAELEGTLDEFDKALADLSKR